MKFSKKQIETAERIANDVSEAIDNGESRNELRDAALYWAHEYSKAQQRLTTLRSARELISASAKLVVECLKEAR